MTCLRRASSSHATVILLPNCFPLSSPALISSAPGRFSTRTMTICSPRASAGMLNLDTHVLLFAIHGRLNPGEQRILRRDQQWSVSAIVLWEIAKLHERGRIPHGLD